MRARARGKRGKGEKGVVSGGAGDLVIVRLFVCRKCSKAIPKNWRAAGAVALKTEVDGVVTDRSFLCCKCFSRALDDGAVAFIKAHSAAKEAK